MRHPGFAAIRCRSPFRVGADGPGGYGVLDCALLFAKDELRLDYVGLLLSDASCAGRVDKHTPSSLRRLAMVPLGVTTPNELIDACYKDLE